MPRYTGVGLSVTFSDEGETTPQTFTFPVTSFTFEEGESPQVDVTSATDNQRRAVPGIKTVPTGTIVGIYEGAVPAWFRQCPAMSILLEARDENCSAVDILGTSGEGGSGFPISTSSVNIEGSMDEAVTITVGFFGREAGS